jgi:phosphopantothenoylcysteine decarboxylase/phosphopantothenate--cysteine ligase
MAGRRADYRPLRPARQKRPRTEHLDVELEPTTDVLAALGATRDGGQVLVGFAADGGRALARARASGIAKNARSLRLQRRRPPDIGFDAPTTRCSSLAGGERTIEKRRRRSSRRVLDEVERLLSER